jgi:hypothetical protein
VPSSKVTGAVIESTDEHVALLTLGRAFDAFAFSVVALIWNEPFDSLTLMKSPLVWGVPAWFVVMVLP